MLDPFGDPFKWRMRYHNAHTLLGVFCLPFYSRKDIIRFGANDDERQVAVYADMRYAVYADSQGIASAQTGASMGVDRKSKKAQSDSIRKRTPREQAIAEKTDRRARYDARLRREGFKRTTIWVREDRLEEVKAFVLRVNEGTPGEPTL